MTRRGDSPSVAKRSDRYWHGQVRPGEFLWRKEGLGVWAHRCQGKTYVILPTEARCDVCYLSVEHTTDKEGEDEANPEAKRQAAD